jgi:hypothetical protein
MRKHAFLRENVVVKIESIDESSYSEDSKECQLLIDVEDFNVQPEIGWVLNGSVLESGVTLDNVDQITSEQQKNQRIFGQKLSPILVDKMGARNLRMSLEGQTPNVSSLLSTLGVVKALAETGALKTARGVMMQVKPAYPLYVDILDFAINEISNFLATMGYE